MDLFGTDAKRTAGRYTLKGHCKWNLDRETFERLYVQERLTLDQISKRVGVPTTTLNRMKGAWGIPKVARYESYVGKKFGLWTVVRETPSGHRMGTTWCHCVCDCGNEADVARGNLQQGLTNSCGCARLLEDGQAGLNEIFSRYQYDAKQRGLLFSLTLDDFAELTKQPCHYCGKPPSQICRVRSVASTYIHSGVDRVVNTEGYLKSNSVPCCSQCNLAKKTQTATDFLAWAKSIHHPTWTPVVPLEPTPAEKEIYRGYQKKALSRGLEFLLSDSLLTNYFRAPCAYCGAPPSNKGPSGYRFTGVDRVDNEVGYEGGNTVAACKRCNFAKRNSTLADFLAWAKRLQDFQAYQASLA